MRTSVRLLVHRPVVATKVIQIAQAGATEVIAAQVVLEVRLLPA
jgi:hypothetical protein